MKKILLMTTVLLSFQAQAEQPITDKNGHTIAYITKQGNQAVIKSTKGVTIGRYNLRTHKLYNKQGKIMSGIK